MAESLSSYDGGKALCDPVCAARKLSECHAASKEAYRPGAGRTGILQLDGAVSGSLGKRSGAADYAKQGLKAFAEKHVSVEKLSRPDHLCQYGFFLYFAGSSQQAYEIFWACSCRYTVPRRDLQSLLRGILRDRALQSLRPRS